jgi:hypothetical protein
MPTSRTLRVFYRDYDNAVSIVSSQPEPLAAARVMPLAERVLAGADNFIGVVDRNDVILQAYPADQAGRVVVEMLYPEADGCLRLVLALADALALLDDLPDEFDEGLMIGAQYVT